MKKYLVKALIWFKSIKWIKWFNWNYICAFVYSANIIVNIIKGDYDVAAAYFVAICLCFIIHLKEKSLKQSNELIKMQGELIDNMLGFITEIDKHNQKAKKN